MTAPLRGTPHPSAIPTSQNTAPVAEFRCLFTHDLKRKQKRWQDGYLKFHTFNNRVMVYDQTRYFLGDTYYKDSNELHEGDELTLDKGIMVEVADAMGVTQTDLTPLFDKKPKESPARPHPTVPPRPFQPPSSVAPSSASRAASQLKHKSLNTLLGASRGPIGKSVPMQSPYEARKEKEQENVWEEERTSKRQKSAQRSAILRIPSPPVDESPAPKKNLSLWARTSEAKSARMPPRPIPQGATIITLDSSSDQNQVISSDVTLPCTSPNVPRSKPKSPVMQAPPPINRQHVTEKPVAKAPKIPRGKVPVPHVKAMETPKRPAPSSSPPVSASNRLTNVDFALQSAAKSPVQNLSVEDVPTLKLHEELVPPPSPPRNLKTKSLRLSAGVKRGMLLCQALPQQISSAGSQSRASTGRHQAKNSLEGSRQDQLPAFDPQAQPIVSVKTSAPKRKALALSTNEVSKRARISASPLDVSLDIFDDPQVVHGLLDQQLMVPSSPNGLQHSSQSRSPPASKVSKLKSAASNKFTEKERIARKPLSTVRLEHEVAQSRSASPKGVARKAQTKNLAVSKSESARKASTPVASLLEPSPPLSRETSPAHPALPEIQSRNPSTSPRKLPLSTGGFCKKPKRNQSQSKITPPAPEPAPAPRNETVALPPHPLRAGRKGPLMTTTELAALLQKPKKPPKDPILDDEYQSRPRKSPARSFRRVRSENDAPIPSISEEWERRNLPKPRTIDVEGENAEVDMNTEVEVKKKPGGLAALVKKTDPRRKFQRTRSLTVDTNVSVEEEADLPSPVVDEDVGPWSTEAFDLFDWRPPPKANEASG